MDEELAVNGDKEAYKRLIEKNKKYLFNIAIAILKNEDDAGDAISETILVAYEHIEELREPKFFKTWITRILINNSNKILKSKTKVVNIEEWQEYNYTKLDNIDNDEILDLRNALFILSKEQYSVVMLFYYNDLKIEDIATILDIPVGTVKSRLNTARENLYKKLAGRKESGNNA